MTELNIIEIEDILNETEKGKEWIKETKKVIKRKLKIKNLKKFPDGELNIKGDYNE